MSEVMVVSFAGSAAVTNLSAYNGGELVFEWVPLDEDFGTNVEGLLADWGVEEWFVSDWDGPSALQSMFGEYPSLDAVREYVDAADAFSGPEGLWESWIEFCGDYGVPLDTDWGDHYRGEWSSFREYAEDLFDDVYSEVVKLASGQSYVTVDYEGFARDLEIEGAYAFVGGHVWQVEA